MTNFKRGVSSLAAILGLAAAATLGGVQAATAQPLSAPVVSAPTVGKPPQVGKPGKPQAGGVKVAKRKPTYVGEPTTMSTCSGSTYCYRWQGGQQSVTNTGLQAWINVQKPFLATTEGSNAHSLGQIYVSDSSGNAVELGWTVDRFVNSGSADPHLFVHRWDSGVGQGYNGGGWVDYAATATDAGSNINADVAGSSESFVLVYDATTPSGGGWWGQYKGQWIGYFPASLWSSPTFTSSTGYQVFGEVAATDTNPCTDMGNGQQGSPWVSPGPAKVSGATGQGISPAVTSFTYLSNNTPGYSQAPNTGGNPNTEFAYGGPGWNSAHTAVGSAGSC